MHSSTRRQSYLSENVAGTVERVEAGVSQPGGVADVMQPCCGNQQCRVRLRYGAGQRRCSSGHSCAVQHSLRVVLEHANGKLTGGGHHSRRRRVNTRTPEVV